MKIKNRKLPIILGGVGVLAVTSIGFATWIIGYQQSTVENQVQVSVDGHKTEGLILECIPSETSIKLAETKVPDGTGNAVTSVTNDGDFNIKLFTFKLNIIDGFEESYTIKSIDFEVTGLPKANVTSTDKFGRTSKEYSYITLANENISFADVSKNPDTSTLTGWKIYDLSTNGPITFKWGDMFDLTETPDVADSPAVFYNKKIGKIDSTKPLTSDSNKQIMEKWAAASEELGAMETAFKSATVKVSVKVNFEQKAA